MNTFPSEALSQRACPICAAPFGGGADDPDYPINDGPNAVRVVTHENGVTRIFYGPCGHVLFTADRRSTIAE